MTSMKSHIYELAMQASRRQVLKGMAGAGALAAGAATLGGFPKDARADFRADLLKIPGVGKGSPTDADWQKVGEMCLGATKESIKEGEFKGVELTFMG
jgi:multiple sugar transport system substrate-binding protein